MTIGPEPTMRIDRRSSLRGIAELLDPALDQRPCVVRPRPGLRMELQRACTELREREPLDGAVVERDVRRFCRLARVDAEAVVLRGHEHAAARALEHRMVRAAV